MNDETASVETANEPKPSAEMLMKAHADGRFPGFTVKDENTICTRVKLTNDGYVTNDCYDFYVSVQWRHYGAYHINLTRCLYLYQRYNSRHVTYEQDNIGGVVEFVRSLIKKETSVHCTKLLRSHPGIDLLVEHKPRKSFPAAMDTPEIRALYGCGAINRDRKVVWMGKHVYVFTQHQRHDTRCEIDTYNAIGDFRTKECSHRSRRDGRLDKATLNRIIANAVDLDAKYPAWAETHAEKKRQHDEMVDKRIKRNIDIVAMALDHEIEVGVPDRNSPNKVVLCPHVNLTINDDDTANLRVNDMRIPTGILPELLTFLKKAMVYQAMNEVEQ